MARAVALPISERAFTDQVIALLRLTGWRCIHVRPGRTLHGWRTNVQGDGVGWPDIVAVRGARLLAIELKTERGKLTPAQERWLEALGKVAGCEVYTWRPGDWPTIEATLKG